MKTKPETPECNKLSAVSPQSQIIGEFLDTLSEQGICLCKWTEWEDAPAQYHPIPDAIEKTLAKYFEIDLDKVEVERRAILDFIRQ
jgi:hypothetical protein